MRQSSVKLVKASRDGREQVRNIGGISLAPDQSRRKGFCGWKFSAAAAPDHSPRGRSVSMGFRTEPKQALIPGTIAATRFCFAPTAATRCSSQREAPGRGVLSVLGSPADGPRRGLSCSTVSKVGKERPWRRCRHVFGSRGLPAFPDRGRVRARAHQRRHPVAGAHPPMSLHRQIP